MPNVFVQKERIRSIKPIVNHSLFLQTVVLIFCCLNSCVIYCFILQSKKVKHMFLQMGHSSLCCFFPLSSILSPINTGIPNHIYSLYTGQIWKDWGGVKQKKSFVIQGNFLCWISKAFSKQWMWKSFEKTRQKNPFKWKVYGIGIICYHSIQNPQNWCFLSKRRWEKQNLGDSKSKEQLQGSNLASCIEQLSRISSIRCCWVISVPAIKVNGRLTLAVAQSGQAD